MKGGGQDCRVVIDLRPSAVRRGAVIRAGAARPHSAGKEACQLGNNGWRPRSGPERIQPDEFQKLKGIVLKAKVVNALVLVGALHNVRQFARLELNFGDEIEQGVNVDKIFFITARLPQARE